MYPTATADSTATTMRYDAREYNYVGFPYVRSEQLPRHCEPSERPIISCPPSAAAQLPSPRDCTSPSRLSLLRFPDYKHIMALALDQNILDLLLQAAFLVSSISIRTRHMVSYYDYITLWKQGPFPLWRSLKGIAKRQQSAIVSLSSFSTRLGY